MKWLHWKKRNKARERELDEEIQADFALEIQQRMEAGATREEAEYAARRDFGNVTRIKEVTRAMWGWAFLERLLQDTRHALRRLRKAPAFTIATILTLALGIGATTAIFSVVNGVLLKPLPYGHPGRLVEIRLNLPGIGQNDWPLSPADYFIFREQSRTFQDIGLYNLGDSVNVAGFGTPERVPALPVTDGLLPILQVRPLLGRLFTRADDSPGSAKTVILTYGYWSSKLGRDRSVIGKTIDVDGEPRTIIGVLPQSFHFLDETKFAMLLPIELNRAETTLGNFSFVGIARLKPGINLGEANADVARMIPIVLRSFPPPPGTSVNAFADDRTGPDLRPLKQAVVGDVGKVLWVLLGGIGLVLLIACANVANLLLLRVDGRRQELAVRAALGASRGRIAAELFLDSLILAVLGGLVGLGLAYGALRVLAALAPASLPRLNEIGIDGSIVLFALAASFVASLLFGSAAIFKYAGTRLGTGLREGGRPMSESRERHRSRGVLVIVQVALAVVLLIGSGLMIRTFHALTEVNPGFVAPSEVQTFRVSIPDTQVKDPVRVLRIETEILHKLEAVPSVSSVGFSRYVPIGGTGGFNNPVFIKDRAYSSGEPPVRRFEFVSPDYLKTVGTPLVAGRSFTWSEIENRVPVAMVSEKFARQYWQNPAGALGNEIRTNTKDAWRKIIGVVGDVHQNGVNQEPPASTYWPTLMAHFGGNPSALVQRDVAFVIRSPRTGSQSFVNEVRQAVRSVDPNLPLFAVHTLNYYYSKSMARTSFTLVMLALAGGMGLLLGIVGLYGVIAYSVSQRRREIGIRMALGARAEDVRKMVVRGGLTLAALGVGIGIVAALGATRFLSSLLYGVKPSDPATFIAVLLLLMAVALLASYIPARQAAKVDPMMVLRQE